MVYRTDDLWDDSREFGEKKPRLLEIPHPFTLADPRTKGTGFLGAHRTNLVLMDVRSLGGGP